MASPVIGSAEQAGELSRFPVTGSRGAPPVAPTDAFSKYATLLARILMSQIFILSGIAKIIDWSGTEEQMAGRGMFWIPLFHVAALLTELVCGLSLLLGFKTRLGALLLFLFLIPVTLTFHNFWTYTDPLLYQFNMLFFMHNLALMGGLLLLMIGGPGPLSIDRHLGVKA